MKKISILSFFILSTVIVQAQFGANGGISMLKAFGTPKPYLGLHIGGELPRDANVTLYGRVATYLKQEEATTNSTFVEARDPLTNPYYMTVNYRSSFNYTTIEGGTRYYLGDGYDSGFGAYGGTNVMIAFNTVKRVYDDYDQAKYKLSTNEQSKGNIFNLGFGLGGGLKNTFAGVGTLYFDASFSYLLISTASNATAASTNMYSQLLFSFNLGFRKEFY